MGGTARAFLTRADDDVLPVALVLCVPVIGLEQVLHTSPAALLAYPFYEALHWLSDSLLALPMAVAAVWIGTRLATIRGYRQDTPSDILVRAGSVAIIFALLLVPGAALHEEADRLTHAHAQLAIHAHGAAAPRTGDAPTVLTYVSHALGDGLEGQVLGLPVTVLAFWATARARRRAFTGSERSRGRAPPDGASGVITQLGGGRRT